MEELKDWIEKEIKGLRELRADFTEMKQTEMAWLALEKENLLVTVLNKIRAINK